MKHKTSIEVTTLSLHRRLKTRPISQTRRPTDPISGLDQLRLKLPNDLRLCATRGNAPCAAHHEPDSAACSTLTRFVPKPIPLHRDRIDRFTYEPWPGGRKRSYCMNIGSDHPGGRK